MDAPTIRRGNFTIRMDALTIRKGNFTIWRGSLTIRRVILPIRRGSLTIRRVPITIRIVIFAFRMGSPNHTEGQRYPYFSRFRAEKGQIRLFLPIQWVALRDFVLGTPHRRSHRALYWGLNVCFTQSFKASLRRLIILSRVLGGIFNRKSSSSFKSPYCIPASSIKRR